MFRHLSITNLPGNKENEEKYLKGDAICPSYASHGLHQ